MIGAMITVWIKTTLERVKDTENWLPGKRVIPSVARVCRIENRNVNFVTLKNNLPLKTIVQEKIHELLFRLRNQLLMLSKIRIAIKC